MTFAQPTKEFSPIEAIARDVIETAALPLEQSRTLPPASYTDEDYFRHEAKSVLESGWQCLAHVSQLKAPGDFLAVDLLGEPLLVIRGKDNAIRVLSRVCAHRAMDIMPEGFDFPREGTAKLLSCPYHHWIYELDGSLRGCAQMQRAAGFEKSAYRLPEFKSEAWHGFVFVNLDGKAPPLAEHYADLSTFIALWKPQDMEIVIAFDWECDFNWKVMVENWTESYHHLGSHSTTLNPMMPGEGTWADAEQPHFMRAHLPYTTKIAAEVARAREGGERRPGFAPVPGLTLEQESEWGLYLGYPTFMLATTADRLIWYCMTPLSAGRLKLKTMTLVRPESKAAPDYEATLVSETKMLRDFHMEDMVVNTAVQRGLSARAAVRGRLSHLEEPIWLLQRYLAARLQGTYPQKAERAPYSGPYARPA
jgi:phenylpropionate dioxygenase-like ring-hydroxylating dioxygenase large terminal subunit